MTTKKRTLEQTTKKDKYEMTDEERKTFYEELEEMRKSPKPGNFIMMDSIIK